MAGDPAGTEELYSFLEKTLATLDSAAGDVDEEAHQKLAQLKQTLQQGSSTRAMLSEASIQQELQRLDGCLASVEEKISQADPLTKDLLGLSAKILTKAADSKEDPPPES